jgi:pyruvate dehydrogenase E2 component (dihydrolipoyllysine-residue acetyltransferase)
VARREFVLPDIGEGLADVEVLKWMVGVGDHINENALLAEIETDKAVVQMPAPASGRIVELRVREGERIAVGAVWLVMEVAGTDEAAGVETAHSQPQARVDGTGVTRGPATAPRSDGAVRASPVARKTAESLGVDLASVAGTGPGGRITVEDIKAAAGAQRVALSTPMQPAASQPASEERIPVRGIRRRIAEAMLHSVRTIPHVTGFQEFDAAELVRLRDRLKPQAERAGVRLTFVPFVVKATVLGLKAHPYLNAIFDEDEPAIVLKKTYNIGVAAATPGGLLVPVIRDADRMGLLDIARRATDLAEAARGQRVLPADLAGGTFTITNVGPAHGWFGTSIIRHPEVAILGIGRIEERPVVRDGQIVARPVMPVSLSFDHRVIDGEEGLAFLATVRELIENPERLLLGEPAWS